MLSQEEFNKRCYEVFVANDSDEYYSIELDKDGEPVIWMSELGDKYDGYRFCVFDYHPDMSNRPQALDYLLGKRNDFND